MRGVRLGYTKGFRDVIRYETLDGAGGRKPGEAHLITVAPTRSGKGRDVLVPALLEFEGSCLVVDPKGQLAAVTGPERARMGQRVIILNPFRILPEVLSSDTPQHFRGLEDRCVFDAQFNPLAVLDPAADSFGVDCDNIADSIVTREHTGDSHWTDSARGLVAGIIGHLVAVARSQELDIDNLAAVRRALTSSDQLQELAEAAQQGDDEFIAENLSRFAEKDAPNKGEVASIISTAKTQTQFIGNKAISESLRRSSFRFCDLKHQPTTVYLVLPTRYLATCGKWFRLLMAAALDDLLREEKGQPVLAIMDEFAQLGRLAVIENAMGLAAGYGLQLWPVLQDLTQLQEHYPKRWETFLSSAEIQMFFAPRENTTAEYVSKLCGETTVTTVSSSTGTSQNEGASWADPGRTGKSQGTSYSNTQRRLFLPQEVRQLGESRFLIFAEKAGNVITAYRKPYFETDEFDGKYSPDPYHRPKPILATSPTAAVPPPEMPIVGRPGRIFG